MASEHIMITCPNVKLPVWTGFRSVRGSSLANLQQIRLKRCPGCGSEHVWDGKDAFWSGLVAEAPPHKRGRFR